MSKWWGISFLLVFALSVSVSGEDELVATRLPDVISDIGAAPAPQTDILIASPNPDKPSIYSSPVDRRSAILTNPSQDLSDVYILAISVLIEKDLLLISLEDVPSTTADEYVVQVSGIEYTCERVFPQIHPHRLYCWGASFPILSQQTLTIDLPSRDGSSRVIEFEVPHPDIDRDGFLNVADDCPSVPGTSTANLQGCPDSDGDSWADSEDNCPTKNNPSQTDGDDDGRGDACDADGDGDGFPNSVDDCPAVQGTSTGNLKGCPDGDGDGWADIEDDCPTTHGSSSANLLGCPDVDDDGWADSEDNCPVDFNPSQADNDGDTQGDACDPDDDEDGFNDAVDDCPFVPGTSTAGLQGCPDVDDDGWADSEDNCPADFNPSQADNDGDMQGDACDPDDDNDGFNDTADDCPFTHGTSTAGLQGCPDVDDDSWADSEDNCPADFNPSQADNDGDMQGDACDPDDDNDGFNDTADDCPFTPGTSTAGLQGCPDVDDDGWADSQDNCPTVFNPGQEDWDLDGVGTACDPTEDADISVQISCIHLGGTLYEVIATVVNYGPSTATGLSGGTSYQVSCNAVLVSQVNWPVAATYSVGESGSRRFSLSNPSSCWVSVGVASLNNPDPIATNDNLSITCP